jgi:heme A synthase
MSDREKIAKALVIASAILAGSFLFVSAITGLWSVYFQKEWWAFFIPFVIGFVLGFPLALVLYVAITPDTPPLNKGGEGDG